MTKQDRFITLVQTEALYEALRGSVSAPPSGVVALAMEIPVHALANDLHELGQQALQLVQWYLLEGPEPDWLPEEVLYEEVYEEVLVDEDEDEDEDVEFEDFEE